MSKRLFQILDDINVADIENETQMVGVFNQVVGGDMNKTNAKISIGIDRETFQKITIEKSKIPILLVIDKDEYFKRKDS